MRDLFELIFSLSSSFVMYLDLPVPSKSDCINWHSENYSGCLLLCKSTIPTRDMHGLVLFTHTHSHACTHTHTHMHTHTHTLDLSQTFTIMVQFHFHWSIKYLVGNSDCLGLLGSVESVCVCFREREHKTFLAGLTTGPGRHSCTGSTGR